MKLTENQQLNKVLSFFSDTDNSPLNGIEILNGLIKFGVIIELSLMREILYKLVIDGYLREHVNDGMSILGLPMLSTYTLTVDGSVFIKNGGYSIDRKRISLIKDITLSQWAAIATIMGTIIALWALFIK
ncbi:hypothetical protein KXQ82_15405 [Mucilaginibacter sp. HMF5004]|uniref:hypothetical protein n=1 Tax=Mucilaginibacter rivuli TaxID=2857527 RepID=UPI001C5DE332|nr:hypothetical protein [Mucilaginibacter rivuli]MBW4891111.1 hypothetical protein [Mucilaginibacter rivuli]